MPRPDLLPYLQFINERIDAEDKTAWRVFNLMMDALHEVYCTRPLIILSWDSLCDRYDDAETKEGPATAALTLRPDTCQIDDLTWSMAVAKLMDGSDDTEAVRRAAVNTMHRVEWPDYVYDWVRDIEMEMVVEAVQVVIDNNLIEK